ncbi:hypothetical protein K431DRAFT_70182 [Polychaeton citri CBS 116435]|uniref:Uncharacterized protein n=1 Tax=Polychaeton citri CBS 116435 TaxID=1314669 RepID=A0A9P4Q6D0_9PEZI|nr:hypothetical protein K431DRAFT_70182 [Polychaeton citri CBS 116435]
MSLDETSPVMVNGGPGQPISEKSTPALDELRSRINIKTLFMPGEHQTIGDSIRLQGHKGAFTIRDGLQLTYSQINVLAGDFFGTSNPITSGSGDKQKQQFFMDAYNTLAGAPSGIVRAKKFLELIHKEEEYVKNHPPAKSAYEKWGNSDFFDIENASKLLPNDPIGSIDYKTLLSLNVDHFQPYAREAYDVGHAKALEEAGKGNLERAYTINAFADHFLQDSFASGHFRVPRKELTTSYAKQVCANIMHNEDNANGLQVTAPLMASGTMAANISFLALGDDFLEEVTNRQNKKQCIAAVQASADEVYHAFNPSSSTKPPSPWQFAPTKDSFLSESNPCPMFSVQTVNGKSEVWMRKDLQDVNAPPPQPGKWEFETVVQHKVLYGPLKYLITNYVFDNWLNDEWRETLCWWSVAYARAPAAYYSATLIRWLEDQVKTSTTLPSWLRDGLVAILDTIASHL